MYTTLEDHQKDLNEIPKSSGGRVEINGDFLMNLINSISRDFRTILVYTSDKQS